MFRFNHSFTSLLAVLLALTLFPFSALAVTEDTLEPAPEISLPEEAGGDTDEELPEEEEEVQDDGSYLPAVGILPQRGTTAESEQLNYPRLTDAELATVRELLAARDAGEQAAFEDRHYANQERVFEAGVYALDPEDFCGRTFYVILPNFQMNRDQLLSLIAAFDELGIPFDPDSLDGTNCTRGRSRLYNPATRRLTGDEQNRMAELQKMIRSGILDRESFTAPSSCRSTLAQMPGYEYAAYDYLEPFCFYPYRAMTDNELAAFAFAQETEWEIRPDLLEKKARQYAHKLFPLPLSMTATDESRYAYSENYIEYRNSFRIDSKSCDGMYDSPEETPESVMVEQDLTKRGESFPEEPVVVRVMIDYPYADGSGSGARCSAEELTASAQRWAEKYLLIPEEDILSEWAFDERLEDWGTVQYRLLTTEWLVCLEMYEADARYCQCCVYDRDYATEFDDWVLTGSAGTGAEEAAETEEAAESAEPVRDLDQDLVDSSARHLLQEILNLPAEMTTTGFSRDRTGSYVQYRTDYSFPAGEKKSADGNPESMIVYQTPYFTQTIGLRLSCVFLSYPRESGYLAELTDEEYRAAAQKWADRTLKISAEEILEDWSNDPSFDTEATVTYQLKTAGMDIYLQMYKDGESCWCGLYPHIPGQINK